MTMTKRSVPAGDEITMMAIMTPDVAGPGRVQLFQGISAAPMGARRKMAPDEKLDLEGRRAAWRKRRTE